MSDQDTPLIYAIDIAELARKRIIIRQWIEDRVEEVLTPLGPMDPRSVEQVKQDYWQRERELDAERKGMVIGALKADAVILVDMLLEMPEESEEEASSIESWDKELFHEITLLLDKWRDLRLADLNTVINDKLSEPVNWKPILRWLEYDPNFLYLPWLQKLESLSSETDMLTEGQKNYITGEVLRIEKELSDELLNAKN